MTQVGILHPVQEVSGSHAFLTSQLQLNDFEQLVLCRDVQRLALNAQRPYSTAPHPSLPGFVNLQHGFLTVGGHQSGPGARHGRQSTHEVVDLLGGLGPVNLAGFLEYLGGRLDGGTIKD